MVIGIDIRAILEPQPTGVTRYMVELVRELLRHQEHQFRLLLTGRHAADVSVPWAGGNHITVLRRRLSNRWLNLRYSAGCGPALEQLVGGCDVFFLPYPLFARFGKTQPVVTTFHDLSFATMPWTYAPRRRLWHAFVNPRRLAHRAQAVIAVSEATRQDMLHVYSLPPERVVVVHSGAPTWVRSTTPDPRALARWKISDPYVLMIGIQEARKNIATALVGWQQARRRGSQLHLVVVGRTGRGGRVLRQLRKQLLDAGTCHLLPYASDQALGALLRGAQAILYPSLDEGFGFPVLEAMQCGVPVIASTAGALPEVCADAALLVRPAHAEDITQALLLLADEKLRKLYSERGLARVKDFSWEKAAAETLEVIRESRSKN